MKKENWVIWGNKNGSNPDGYINANTAPINPHIEPNFLQILLLNNSPIPISIIATLQWYNGRPSVNTWYFDNKYHAYNIIVVIIILYL